MELPEPLSVPATPATQESSSSMSECIIVRDSDSSSVITVDTGITSIMSAGNNTSKPNSRVATPSSDDLPEPTIPNAGENDTESAPKSEEAAEKELDEIPVRSTRVLRQRPSRPEPAPKTPKSTKKSRSPVKTGVEKQPSPQLSEVIQIRGISETINVKDEDGTKRRRSARLSLLASELNTSAITSTPKQDVGKRTHEVMNAGSRSASAKLGSSTWSTKPRNPKRVKVEEESDSSSESEEEDSGEDEEGDNETGKQPEQSKRRVKQWATQGLYVGQEEDFDPRRRTKRGRLSGSGVVPPKRKPALPLPMFHGLDIMNNRRDFKLPFHIFSPSPYKINPPGWKSLSRNVFVGDARELWKSEFEPSGKCVCTPETGCDENCINRCVYYECNDENCNVGPEFCQNRHFAALRQRVLKRTKFAEGVEVIKTPDRGYGLRAIRSFEPNQIIVEYCGEIISQEETDWRMRKLYKNNSSYYLMLFDQSMIIDATRGSIARFVNHSCEPNCRMEKWIVDNKPRMALFAGENGIQTGEELTYDYNFNWFSGVSQQVCRCGSSKCRGAMGKRSDGRKQVVEEKPKITSKKKSTGIQSFITVGAEKTKKSTPKMASKATKASTAKPERGRSFKVVKKTIVKKVINKKVVKKTIVKAPAAKASKPQPPSKSSTLTNITVGYQRRVGKTYGRARHGFSGVTRTIKAEDPKEDTIAAEIAESKPQSRTTTPVQRPRRTAHGTIQNLAKTIADKSTLQGAVLDTIVVVG